MPKPVKPVTTSTSKPVSKLNSEALDRLKPVSPERAEAIAREVGSLLEAGVLKPVDKP